jgi:uncharacterized protein
MKGNYTKEQNNEHVNIVLKNALYCRIGMADKNLPYVVTVNFGYDESYIYFHGSEKGKKVDIITANPNVCFQLDYGAEILSSAKSCNWGTKFRSIIGYGKVELLSNEKEKEKALLAIMEKYSGKKEHEFNEHVMAHTNVYRIKRNNIEARHNHWKWEE